jgi:aminodeoxyfutalosine deaminase
MIFRARIVVPLEGPPIENGAVVVEENQVVAVGGFEEIKRTHSDEVEDLGEMALLPGFINAHCHLDYTILRHSISPPASFAAWVQRLNSIKRMLGPEDYVRSVVRGFEQCEHWGTTTVCTIESFPEIMPLLPQAPVRTWWFYEMIDVRHRITTDDVVAGALMFFQHRGGSLSNFGLSPHAPFTASANLYRLATACSRSFSMPLTTHVAESREEWEMFREARGPMFDLLKSIGRPMEDCGEKTPFSLLWNAGAIDARWLLAHMNELADEDFLILEQLPRGSKPSIVHCPGSHAYFKHAPFQWERLHALGVNICVATDSLASTDTLSLFAELRRAANSQPWLTPEELLFTVTRNPARALGRKQQLGVIAPGAWADLIALPASGNVRRVYEDVIAYEREVPWVMIDGNVRQRELADV